jgi:hypothetical protein
MASILPPEATCRWTISAGDEPAACAAPAMNVNVTAATANLGMVLSSNCFVSEPFAV